MPKQINERPDFGVYLEADASGLVGALCRLRHELGEVAIPVDVVAASQAAAAALAPGIVLTAAQVRAVWKQLGVQAFAQAKAGAGF